MYIVDWKFSYFALLLLQMKKDEEEKRCQRKLGRKVCKLGGQFQCTTKVQKRENLAAAVAAAFSGRLCCCFCVALHYMCYSIVAVDH